MNAIHIYAWEDAPESLRKIADEMVPDTHTPRWIAWSERRSKPPTYLVAFLSKAWIDMMNDGWHRVFFRDVEEGELRIGCEKKR